MAYQPPPPPIEPGGPVRTSSASRSGGAPPPQPAPLRALLLPFSPELWRQAATRGAGWVIGPLLLLALLAGLALGAVRGLQVGPAIRSAGATYDSRFDPVVYERGQVRVEGPRLPRVSDASTTLLVDPDETFQPGDMPTPEWVIVRRDVVLRQQAFGPQQSVPLAQLEPLLGPGPVRVDGAWFRGFADRWGVWLGLGTLAIVLVGSVIGNAIVCPLYALLAGTLLFLLRRPVLAAFGAAFRMALATSALPVVGTLALSLLQVDPPCCLTVVFWPVAMAVAGLLAVGGRIRL